MSKIKAYIRSFRLRTLPLSVAGIVLGTMLAAADGAFRVGGLDGAIVANPLERGQ